ncbi:hypothetical protein K788_0006541 [Paraburkholderia caribensis MBA4]|uniref:Uncharacterized protein n=1 Tax=Paraburkholderia caribensis MBA4 TaxID=1323664 RepID=A0A0P0R850_9BURK|nr:hypothetical protein K788_0006541 [Paraburkholderia caribensis MBA4]
MTAPGGRTSGRPLRVAKACATQPPSPVLFVISSLFLSLSA